MSFSEDALKKIEKGESNPFWTIEALGEQIGSLRYAINRNDPKGIDYHLGAIQDYQREVFNVMAALLPELYESSEGERAPTLPPDAYERARKHVARLNGETQ